MNDAIVAAASALLGALIGGAATVATTWLAARHERAMRKADALLVFRTEIAKSHQEHEVREFLAYEQHLHARMMMTTHMLARLIEGDRSDIPMNEVPIDPPSFLFVPPVISCELDAQRVAWVPVYRKLWDALVDTEGPQPEVAQALGAKLVTQHRATAATMKAWASRLRSGLAALDHEVVRSDMK